MDPVAQVEMMGNFDYLEDLAREARHGGEPEAHTFLRHIGALPAKELQRMLCVALSVILTAEEEDEEEEDADTGW